MSSYLCEFLDFFKLLPGILVPLEGFPSLLYNHLPITSDPSYHQQTADQKPVVIYLLFFIFPEIGIKLLQFLIQRRTSLSCLNRNPCAYFIGLFYESNHNFYLLLTLLL